MKYELDEYNRDRPDDELLADLNQVARILGSQRVTIDQYEEHGRFHPSTLQRRFGGWLKALDRAGLSRTRTPLDVPDDELLADLNQVAATLASRTITQRQYSQHGRFSPGTLYRRFGSWFKALSLAGLDRTRNLNISDEEWFENLANVWEALGRQPRYGEVARPLSKYSAGGYATRFGSWRGALEAFVSFVNAVSSPKIGESVARDMPVTERHPIEKSRARETSRSISWRLRYLVMRRDNFKCCLCGTSPALQTGIVLEVDHKVPWSKGGESLLENLQTLCQVCNNGKSNLSLTEAELG